MESVTITDERNSRGGMGMETSFKKFHLHWNNIVFCSQNKSLLSFSLKIRIPVMQIFVNCSSWKAKEGGGGQPL